MRDAPAFAPPDRVLVVALHRGRSLVSRLIRWQTGGEHAHASLVVPWYQARAVLPDRDPRSGRPWPFADDDTVLFEAREGVGVTCDRTIDAAFAEGRIDLRAIRCTASQQLEVLAWWGQRVGVRGYDWSGVLRFVTRQRAAASDERWFCSEAVFVSLAAAGLPPLRAPAWRVSPAVLGYSPLLGDYRPAARPAPPAVHEVPR